MPSASLIDDIVMKTRILIVLLIAISMLPLIDLMHPGLPKGHDTPDHVARIANFYQSLSEGNIVPRWAGNLNWGYGHPILMFLYPFPSYIASFFHSVGFSLVDSTKLVFTASFVISMVTMFVFARAAWGTVPGVAAAVLYGFAPYRFVDLYVRGAIGEHVAFIFPPLIFYGLLQIARNQRSKSGGVMTAISIAGLLLSHNAIALMILPLILMYVLYLYFFETKNQIRFLSLVSCFLFLGFALSAFFWIPAYFEGKYTLRDIVTKGDFTDRFVLWQQFFLSPWNYGGGNEFTKALGFPQWIVILTAMIVFFRTTMRSVRWFIGGAVVCIFAALLLMTSGSKTIWDMITLLQKFQFPWRLLTVTVFIAAVLGAVTISNLPKRLHVFTALCLLTIALVSTLSMWQAPEYIVKPEEYYSGIYDGTTDTGESSPIWSVRFMERRPRAHYEIIEGKGMLEYGFRSTTQHEFTVNAASDVRVMDNTLYFPGWEVFVDGRSLDLALELQYQDPNYRGLMTFRVPAGDHRVMVSFGETKLRRMANLLSVGGLILLLITVIVANRKSHLS